MCLKKWLSGLAVLLVMIVGATTLVSLGVSAQSDAMDTLETANAIEVIMKDNYFSPDVITIPNGKTTSLKLKNAGNREHTFTVEKLGIDVEVQPGKETTITVSPKSPGTYKLICRYHSQDGMVGKVIVK
jgi:plastocyanin